MYALLTTFPKQTDTKPHLAFDLSQAGQYSLVFLRRRNPSFRARISRTVKRIKDQVLPIMTLDDGLAGALDFGALVHHRDFKGQLDIIRYDAYLAAADGSQFKVLARSFAGGVYEQKLLFEDGYVHAVRLFVTPELTLSLEVERLYTGYMVQDVDQGLHLKLPEQLSSTSYQLLLRSGKKTRVLKETNYVDYRYLNFTAQDLREWRLWIRFSDDKQTQTMPIVYLGATIEAAVTIDTLMHQLTCYATVEQEMAYRFNSPLDHEEAVEGLEVTETYYDSHSLQIQTSKALVSPSLYLVSNQGQMIVLPYGESGYDLSDFRTIYGDGNGFPGVFNCYLHSQGQFYRLFKPINPEVERFGPIVYLNKEERLVDARSLRLQFKKTGDLILRYQNFVAMQRAQGRFTTQLREFRDEAQGYRLKGFVSAEYIGQLKLDRLVMVSRNTRVYSAQDFALESHYNSLEEGWNFEAVITVNEYIAPIYQDLFISAYYQDQAVLIKLSGTSQVVKDYIADQVFSHERYIEVTDIDESGQSVQVPYLMFPYITINGNIAFEFRQRKYFENEANQTLELTSISQLAQAGLLGLEPTQTPIWVIFEKDAQGGHDNGFHFFKYVYEHHPEVKAYYVIELSSPDAQYLAPYMDRVLPFMSEVYFKTLAQASLLISSDTKYHVYNTNRRHAPFAQLLADKPLVYLQHGVNGLKQVPAFHKGRGLLQYIMAPTQYEKDQINVKQWGYEPSEVAVTGFARWDSYRDKTGEIPYTQIFVMPTWRKWMDGMTREAFKDTDFFRQYDRFLNSSELKQLLTRHNARIAFFLHPYFKRYVDLFEVDETIIDRYGYLDMDLGEAMMQSSLMITDYSSVAWDQFYLNRPVIFYQFDQADYLATEKAYMDYASELFGPVTFSPEETIQAIADSLKQGCQLSAEFATMRMQYFTYLDQDNAKRIFEAIQAVEKTL